MRRPLGTLTAAVVTCVTLVVTAGCGSSSSTATDPGGDPASGPASDTGPLPSRSPGVIDGAEVLPLLSMTGVGGGQVQGTAAPLDTRADITAFARQFRMPGVRERIHAAVDDERAVPGHHVVGQIVAVGCDVPPGAEVTVNQDGDVQLVPHEVAIAVLPAG
jgi:hypothetical protein